MNTDAWTVTFDGYDPADEGTREALGTLANGVFATRAAAPEAHADQIHYPGTYAAGVFNRLVSHVEGRKVRYESIVNLPNWLSLTFRPAGGEWLHLDRMEVLDYQLTLDVRHGVLGRRFLVADRDDRHTLIIDRRLVHMGDPRLAALSEQVIPQNWSGPLEIRTGIDGGVENRNVTAEHALDGTHLRVVATGGQHPETIWLEAETSQSHLRVAVAARTRIHTETTDPTARRLHQDHTAVFEHLTLDATAGQPIMIDKVVAVSSTLDRAISEPRDEALTALDDAGDFDTLYPTHALAWEQLWGHCQIELRGDDIAAARTLRLHAFHVLQTLSPHIADRDVGVPARGLHGEAYRGHIFWDELFVFPYLNLRTPEITRSLLLYRHRRLGAARRLARDEGHVGATFPWQSGSDGAEETPREFFNPRSGRWMPDHSRRQRHQNLAIAFNVWQYYQVTADRSFLASHGAEMLVEIARYFTDRATHDAGDGRFHLRGVMGPDEFHDGYPDRPGEGIDDNAYINVLTSWLLRRAAQTYALLGDHHCDELWERLGLTRDEVARWDEVSRGLAVSFHHGGIISQFAGYEHLAELDWAAYRRRYTNIGRLDLILEAEGDTTNRYQCAKQADVLMLLYLFSSEELVDLLAHLGYRLDPAGIPPIVDYYLTRSSDGSTLSRVAHAWVLARSDRARSLGIFHDALVSDTADIQGGTTREGIHLGAMGGTLDLAQRCYSGIEPRDDVLWFNPHLPAGFGTLRFSVAYRGHWLDIDLSPQRLRVSTRPCAAAPITIALAGNPVELAPGDTTEIDLGPEHTPTAPSRPLSS